MQTTFFPKGLEKGKTKLPIGRNFGRIPIDCVNSYGVKEVMMSKIGVSPTLFVDLEAPREEFKIMKTLQIHLGFDAKFSILSNDGNKCKSKPRVDCYIPITQLDSFIKILEEIRKTLKDAHAKT